MRKNKNNDFKTPFKFPRSNVSEKKEQAPQETLSYRSVKYSVTYPAKRTKIDSNNSNVEDELSHKKLKVLKERNTNDELPETFSLDKFNYPRPTFAFSQSLKKLSRPFKIPTFIKQIENSNSQNGQRNSRLGTCKPSTVAKPVHDPKAENTIILYDPMDEADHLQENIKRKDRSVAEILGTKNSANMKVHVIVGMIYFEF